MIFEKYRLKGGASTALDEGDGFGILQKFRIFGISDEKVFFILRRGYSPLPFSINLPFL